METDKGLFVLSLMATMKDTVFKEVDHERIHKRESWFGLIGFEPDIVEPDQTTGPTGKLI